MNRLMYIKDIIDYLFNLFFHKIKPTPHNYET